MFQSNSKLLITFQKSARVNGFELDSAQVNAVSYLEPLLFQLVKVESKNPFSRYLENRRSRLGGLYLWGGVGRGKSFLMDSFYNFVPIKKKQRIHFHRFMQNVHKVLAESQGIKNPLKEMGKNLSKSCALLCLDEFQVTDIGDAMIMRNLLEALFFYKVVLITTSNQHPDQLYLEGLQRAQFFPAIQLLKKEMSVVELDSGVDYRLKKLEKAGVFHSPNGDAAEAVLEQFFNDICSDVKLGENQIEIEGRMISVKKIGEGVIWFEFDELCVGARGKEDYIEIGRRYHTVIISNVTRFQTEHRDVQRRFTWLIDEFYDRKVKLLISADCGVDVMFSDVIRNSENQRTESRLIEMQSRNYLGKPHLG